MNHITGNQQNWVHVWSLHACWNEYWQYEGRPACSILCNMKSCYLVIFRLLCLLY